MAKISPKINKIKIWPKSRPKVINSQMHGMGKEQLGWEKEKKVVPLVEQSQEILAWLGKLSYQ